MLRYIKYYYAEFFAKMQARFVSSCICGYSAVTSHQSHSSKRQANKTKRKQRIMAKDLFICSPNNIQIITIHYHIIDSLSQYFYFEELEKVPINGHHIIRFYYHINYIESSICMVNANIESSDLWNRNILLLEGNETL